MRDTLPFNYLDQDVYLLADLDRVARSHPGASIDAEWSLLLPGRPRLVHKVEGKRSPELHWEHLIQAAREAGYIEIKPLVEVVSSRLPSTD